MTNIAETSRARYDFTRTLLRAHLPVGSIVEFGAAPGDQLVELARAGYECTAVDIGIASDAWADAEEGRMVRLFEQHGITAVWWNLEHAPYPIGDDTFDAVIMTEVFEHLRDYPIRSLEQAFRVLRPGGILVFTTPNAAYIGSRLKLLRGQSPATPLGDWVGGVPHARHAREYTFSEVHTLMEMVGFSVEVSESHHFYLGIGSPTKRLVKRVVEFAASVRQTLGPSIVVLARKPLV